MALKLVSSAAYQLGTWQETAHDIYLGMVISVVNTMRFFKMLARELLLADHKTSDQVNAETESPPETNESTGPLRVLGAGYGRTGTVSGF